MSSSQAGPGGGGGGRRRRWGRFLTIILLVAGGVQIPILAALRYLVPQAWPALLLAALGLTAVFVVSMRGNLRGESTRLRIYLGLWPFFLWWTVALLFALLAPLGLAAAAILPAVSLGLALKVTLGAAAAATVPAVTSRPRLRRMDIAVAGLPAAFEGYRIAQISDLHCGPFAGGARVAGWVRAVNALQPDAIAVTGDLIAHGERYVPVVVDALGALRAKDRVFACMGNHDYFTDGEALAAALERAGLTVLRNRGVTLWRAGAGAGNSNSSSDGGGAALFVAGVDDTWTRRHDLDRALRDRPAGVPVVLLAHDPALFPDAVARGVDLTLSGHTHGGQLGIPGIARRLNLARIITAFTSGMYRQGPSTLYVNRGLGTTGPPVRLGVPPEIALLTLRRAQPAEMGVAPLPAPATG